LHKTVLRNTLYRAQLHVVLQNNMILKLRTCSMSSEKPERPLKKSCRSSCGGVGGMASGSNPSACKAIAVWFFCLSTLAQISFSRCSICRQGEHYADQQSQFVNGRWWFSFTSSSLLESLFSRSLSICSLSFSCCSRLRIWLSRWLNDAGFKNCCTN